MEVLVAGLTLGLLGSFHCVGMCGPIALTLLLHEENFAKKLSGGLLYNLGRTVTYGLMGTVFGLVGQGFKLAGFQKWVSIIMGTAMILSVLTPALLNKLKGKNEFPFSAWVRERLAVLLSKKSFGRLFFIGLFNGLLPCGLVYMAIAGSIATTDLYFGIWFMILFGLGTMPMLLIVSMAGGVISISLRNRINRIIPYAVVLIGVLFIFRGLSLGIPLISPPSEKLNPAIHQHVNSDSTYEPHGRSCCGSD
jgi:sulfite exporter TauE/SafE